MLYRKDEATNNCLYKNHITLEKIKKILSPNKTNKDFINLIFKPLKDSYQLTFTDSFGEKHLSSFMKGNYDEHKRLNVRKLKLWSELICKDSVFQEMQTSLTAMIDVCGMNIEHEIYQLISYDRCEMPVSFFQSIEESIKSRKYDKSILMLILWSIYGKEQIDLLYPIYRKAHNNVAEKAVLLSHTKPCRPVFMGRDELLSQIHIHFLSGNNFLFLQGMGGIGKSECAKRYAERYKDNYDTVIFAEYSGSIISLINDNNVFTLTEPFISERVIHSDGIKESDTEFYKRKLTQLRLSSTARTLIIFDNLDEYDLELEKLFVGPFQVLITTRCNLQSVYPQNTIIINEIQRIDILKKIFSEYYEKDISSDTYAEQLIELFQGHTMALELIAKQMKASCLMPKEMLSVIETNAEYELQEVFLMPNYDDAQRNLSYHMQKLFDIATLTDTEKYILMCMTLIPLSGMGKRSFKHSCGLKSYNEVNNLISRSWIREFDGILSIHTLVKETIQITCKPNLLKCKRFIDGLMREFTAIRCYHANRAQKEVIEKIAIHIYKAFPEPLAELYDFYEWLELIFSHCCQYERSVELAQKLHDLYEIQFGNDHFRTARMVCRIASGHIHFFRIKDAIELLEQGRETIKRLKNKSILEELYISDVDLILSNQYLDFYGETNQNDILMRTEELCIEMIDIRNRCYEIVDDPLYTSCVVAYRNLSRIEIKRHNYDKASAYLKKAMEDCKKTDSDFNYYFKDYAQALLEMECHNPQKAIDYLVNAIKINECYFGKYDTRVTKLSLELCRIYEKNGDTYAARAQYQKIYDLIKSMPYQDEKLISCVEAKLKQ
mgnify:CR=1 FL=1